MIAILLPSIAFVLSVKHGSSNGFDCSREMGFFIAGNDSVKSCSSFCSGVASDEFAFSLDGLDFCSMKITFPPSVLVRRTDWFASTQFVTFVRKRRTRAVRRFESPRQNSDFRNAVMPLRQLSVSVVTRLEQALRKYGSWETELLALFNPAQGQRVT
jgi:hypothetical protein